MLLVALALAGEPGPGGIEVRPTLPALSTELTLSWDQVGFVAAATDAAAYGPEHLALGPDGRWALWDPVRLQVVGEGDALPVDRVDSLAFDAEGDLWLLDESSRTLSRWSGGELVSRVTIDRLCPTGVRLVLDGDEPRGIDVFGNSHRLVGGATLSSPTHTLHRNGASLTVDGRAVPVPSDLLSARLLGDWVLIEAGRPGAVRLRQAIAVDTFRTVTLPTRAGQRYRAADDVGVGPDGDLGWIDPQADGLHLHRVSP